MVEDNGELHKLSQSEARRNEGADCERQPVEASSRCGEIARKVGGWLGCTWPRAQDHGDLRGQEDLREEPVERNCHIEWPETSSYKGE